MKTVYLVSATAKNTWATVIRGFNTLEEAKKYRDIINGGDPDKASIAIHYIYDSSEECFNDGNIEVKSDIKASRLEYHIKGMVNDPQI